MGNNMTYLYDTIPIKTRLKMLAARTARLWLLPLEALLQVVFGPNK